MNPFDADDSILEQLGAKHIHYVDAIRNMGYPDMSYIVRCRCKATAIFTRADFVSCDQNLGYLKLNWIPEETRQ